VTGTCRWTVHDDFEADYFETSCGQAFTFLEGTPLENGMRFCCYCGKPLEGEPMAKNGKAPRKYHVLFAAGSPKLEDDFLGSDVRTHDNVLVIENAAGEAALLFASGTWTRCELSTRDE